MQSLDKAEAFYHRALGLDKTVWSYPGALFMSAGGYHHHVGLNTLKSLGCPPPPEGHTGLHHIAFVYPDRPSLARAVRRVVGHGIVLAYKADHGVSEAVYFHDPDVNMVEIYFVHVYDRT